MNFNVDHTQKRSETNIVLDNEALPCCSLGVCSRRARMAIGVVVVGDRVKVIVRLETANPSRSK